MAVTKIKALRTTLGAAINYIINPDKTQNGCLTDSFGCAVETADLEMWATAQNGRKVGNRVGYHLMQSFSPDDEITPQKALEIGMEFAKKVTGGRCEFVVSTHVDRDHIHNHIIFNATNFVDYKKYHYNRNERNRIRSISDKLCRDNNLSVIETPSGVRGKSWHENEKDKSGESWKQRLKQTIDEMIKKAESFDEFIGLMELEGYEVKRGKHISFRAPGQERFTRAKRIGEDYTEEAITARIQNKEQTKSQKQEIPHGETKKNKPSYTKDTSKINLVIDISKNMKAQQSPAYERALEKVNLDTLVKTMNFLIDHNIKTVEDLQIYTDGKMAEYELLGKDLKDIDDKLLKLSEKIKFTQNYNKYKKIYQASKTAADKEEFYKRYEKEIVSFRASLLYFKRAEINPETIALKDLFEEYKNIKDEKFTEQKIFSEMKKEQKELWTIVTNIEKSLDIKIREKEENEKNEKRRTDKNVER